MTRSKSDAEDFVMPATKESIKIDGFKIEAPCKITIKLSENSYLNIFEDFYSFQAQYKS